MRLRQGDTIGDSAFGNTLDEERGQVTTRREFIGRAGAVAGAAAFGLAGYPGRAGAEGGSFADTAERGWTANRAGLRILILGGTGFIGPHVVRHALARGHEITLFNRGRTNTHLFPGVEKLVGGPQ